MVLPMGKWTNEELKMAKYIKFCSATLEIKKCK